jgi:GntR family transcriptional repressor for pyruvate dehydrogenase complex
MSTPQDWTSSPGPFQRVSAVEHVFDALRDAIRDGVFPVGSKLEPEATLASRFGVSRSVVREALRSCNVVGLTRTQTGKGTFVIASHPPATTASVPFGDYSAAELQEARPHIEVPAASLAAKRRTRTDLEMMEALVDRMKVVHDVRSWDILDSEFHQLIARASGNRVLASIVTDLRAAIGNQSAILALVPGRRDASNDEHASILAAIVAGSPDEAGQAMAAHLDAVRREFAAKLRETSSPSAAALDPS